MDKVILKQILTEYNQKRIYDEERIQKEKKALEDANPKLKELNDKIAKISLDYSKKLLTAKKEDQSKILSEMKKETASLIKEKNSFIKELTKDSNLLQPRYDCKYCKDTGYVTKGGKEELCTCVKQKIFNISYNKSNIGNLDKENFSNFDLRFFSDKPNKELYNSDYSPRENISLIREKAMSFIENFDNPNEKNLMFTGSTGLGKTFMTNCIAAELLKEGKTVLYQTAPVMLDSIIDERFNKNSTTLMDNILSVDLLIIDDLGAETVNDYKITDLFTIINTRLLNQNHKITKTIITTNLTLDEVHKIYTQKVFSRLAGNYRFIRFFGEDLRLNKAKKIDE